jgi:hypothetical protein
MAARSGCFSIYIGKVILDTLLILLSFATLRLLVRQELRDFFRRSLPAWRRWAIVACVLILAATWHTVISRPRPVVFPNQLSVKSCLKNLGTALEMYSTDHNGAYPERLEEVTPLYVRAIPKLAQNKLTPREKAFYAGKYGKYNVDLEFSYEVNSSRTDYTITYHTLSYEDNYKSTTPIRYTPGQGLVE